MEDTYSQSNQENTPPAGGPRNNTVVWFGVTLIAALLGLAGGLGLGSLLLEPSETTAPSATLAELSQLQEQVQGLQADLDTRTAESLALASDLETAGAQEADLRAQISQRDAQMGTAPQEGVVAPGELCSQSGGAAASRSHPAGIEQWIGHPERHQGIGEHRREAPASAGGDEERHPGRQR